MKISYAITVCDEFVEIQKLLSLLLKNKRNEDEIVVLVDLSKNSPTSELVGYLHKLSSNDYITLVKNNINYRSSRTIRK
jgi:mannose/fructose-specific phosphotransferase system component IIA